MTEKRLPIAYGVLSGEQTRALIKELRGEQRFDVFCAPVLTVPDSSSGMIHIGNEKPFVVGVRGGQHEVRTIDCGFTCQLRPQIQLDDTGTKATEVSLSYELMSTNILNVDEVTWRAKGRVGVTVQIPETLCLEIDHQRQ